jgi:colicin import membrane protein
MSTTTIARTTCKYPGCGQPAAPAAGTGRPPEYCAGRGHTRASAWRERRRLAAEQAGTTISPAEDGSPLTTAKMTGAELLRSLRAEADRITALGAGLRERIDTLTDPTAAEAEVEAVRAAAEQRAATAEARAAAAGQRAEADAAAEEMSEHLTDAQALAQAAGRRAAAAENQRDEAVRQARAEADQRVAAAGAERDAAVAQARADAGQRVRTAGAERDQARQAAAAAEDTARHAGQETARAQAAARAAQAETERVRADAGKMLDQVRAEAARERDELRADLRARAERQADAYRDELDRLRAASHDAPTANGSSPAGVKTTRRAAPTPAA